MFCIGALGRGGVARAHGIAALIAALVSLNASTGRAEPIESALVDGSIAQPGEMVIDPIRDGTVVVLARDGRYLEAAFGGTPWTGIRPRSTYLLSTCVEDRVFEAPIVKRYVDLSGCEASGWHRFVIAESAIPTIVFRNHGFIFGPVVLPQAQPVVGVPATPIVRPPVFSGAFPAHIALPSAFAGLPRPVLSSSATGPSGAVVISGGNAFTFQWGAGQTWIGGLQVQPGNGPVVIPPAVVGAGATVATIVPLRPSFNPGSLLGQIPGLFGPPPLPHLGPVHSPGIVTPVAPAVPKAHAHIMPPSIRPNVVVSQAPTAAAGSRIATLQPHPMFASALPWIAPMPPGIQPNALVPRISGVIAVPIIVGGPSFHPVYGAAFNWSQTTPIVPPFSMQTPRVFGAGLAAPSIVSPLHLAPVVNASILPRGSIASDNGRPSQGPFGTYSNATVWNAVAPAVRNVSDVRSGIHVRALTGHAGQSVQASSFNPGVTPNISGSPIVYGVRR